MATVYTTAIQELYVAYFNRPADAAGLAYWETVVAAAEGDTSAVSAAFAASAEYEAEYGDLSDAQVVNQIYLNLFGRNAEPDGIAYWANLLTSGAVTVDAAVTAIAGGAQGTDDVAYTSKVTVATAFTEALDTQAEKDGYTGDLANAAAKEFLADIKTAADVTAALVPAALNASVTAVITAAPAFTLANGLEALSAANTAKSDFLADAAEIDAVADAIVAVDPDAPTDAEIEAGIAVVEAAAAPLVDGVLAGYSGATVAVRAAMLALAETSNAEDLADAEAALAEAQGNVDDMSGLAAAVLELEVATENDADATEAAALATVAVSTAESTFNVKNAGDLATADAGVTYTSGATTVAELEDGEYSIPSGVTASNFPGLTEFVAAKNAKIAADSAAVDAAAELVLATKNVNYMDAAATSEDELEAVAEAFVFQSAAIEDKPSAQEIATEVEQFASMLADLDEAADAANTGDTYATVIADLSADLTAAASAVAIKALTATAVTNGYITTADKAEIDAGANGAAAAALLADNNWQARSDTLDDAITALDVVEGAAANTLVDALGVAEGDVETAEDAIETLADAIATFNETEELVAGLADADEAIADALAAFGDNDFANPIIVTGIKFGTAADDVFLAGTADGTIKNFNAIGDDSLYIGTGFTVNTNDLEDGNNAVLEVFINADGANTVISIETSLFGSNAATPEVIEIILTGVAAGDVSLANGFITVA